MSFLKRVIRNNREISLFLLDLFSISISYILAFLLRFLDSTESIFLYSTYFKNIIIFLPVVLILNYIFFFILGINKSLWKYTGLDEVARICFASVLANLIWFSMVFLIPIKPYIRSIPVVAMILQIVIMLGLRFVYRWIQKKDLEKVKHKNALIIGAGSAGNLLSRDILNNDNYDCKVIGFIDDNTKLTGKRISGINVLGTVEQLANVVAKENIDIIFVAIPSASKKRISEIVAQCNELHVKTNIMDYTVKSNLQEKSTLRDVSIEDLLGREEIKLDDISIKEYLANKIIMITGAGGSIGSELCRQVLKYKPKKMILFDIYENNLYALQQEIIIKKRKKEIDESIEIICLLGSVRDSKRLNEVMSCHKIDVLYHAAAHKHVPLVESSPKEAIKNNVLGTFNTLNACIKNEVKKFILISTDKAVNPTNVMGATKRATELIVQSMRDNGVTKVGAVRFGNVLGSNGSVIPLFREQILAGGPITVTDKNIERYFMTIPEATQLVLQAGAYANHGDVFVLDMGTRVKILKLAEDMISLSGLKPYEDIDIQFVGLRPGEKMYEELSLGNEIRYKTQNELVFVNEPMDIDAQKLRETIFDLEESVESKSDEESVSRLFNLIEYYK